MSRTTIHGLRPLALAIVLLIMTTAVAGSVLLRNPEPDLSGRISQVTYPATLNVTVKDDASRPISSVTISIANITGSWQTDTNGNALINVSAEPAGTQFILSAQKAGYQASEPAAVTAHANKTTNVTMVIVGGKIIGFVYSSSIPQVPIVGAAVSISALGPTYYVLTAAQGVYTLSGIPEGTYSVTANATGYISRSQDILVSLASSGVGYFFLPSQNGSISGFVSHALLYTPLNNTNVSVNVGSFVVTVTTGSDGSYNITNLPPGNYTLTASKSGFNSNTTTAEVLKGERTENVNLTLSEKPTRLHGVIRSGTLLLVSAEISVVGTSFGNVSGADGTYQIRNLTAGTYSIQASRTGYVTAVYDGVVIAPGGDTELNMDLKALPGAILRGVVINSENQKLPNIKVTLISANVQQNSTTTNIDGEFAFTGLTVGNYTLQFEGVNYRPMQITHVTLTNSSETQTFIMSPLRQGFSGFIFGFDMPHSMMILALFLTIIMLGVAVYLRIRNIQKPGSAPAVYDEEELEEESRDKPGDLEDTLSESRDEGKGFK